MVINSISSLVEASPDNSFDDLDKLPSELEETKCIEDLMDGRVAYVVPWSIWVNSEGLPFINKRFQFKDEPGGTNKMRITREGDRVVVFMDSISGETFPRQSAPTHSGATIEGYIPVIFRRIKGGKK